MPSIDPETFRHQLAVLCRGRRSRRMGFPRHWNAGCMSSAATGMRFTDDEAWHFIADRIEEGHEIQVIDMDDKPGTHGFVLLVDVEGHDQPLYIKVQLGSGVVIGRSFHWSTKDH